MDEAPGDGDGVGQFRGGGADFPPPNHEFTSRSRKIPQGTDSQDVDPGSLGFTLNCRLQSGFQCVTA